MCGIIGGFHRQGQPFGEKFAQMACQQIRHRGPDGQGFYETEGMLVGNRRLSILDIAEGGQPMFSDDEQIVVVQNGEIYNFVELSKGLGCKTACDTEVILRLYERDGEAFVKQLNGMFAIAILDRRKKCLLLYRDRIGQKPLYIYEDEQRLLFASEIKSLLSVGVSAELDRTSLDAYLTYNFTPPPATLFKNIRHLPPGAMLKIDSTGSQQSFWWRLEEIAETKEKTPQQWSDELLEILQDAVRIRLRSDVPLGAFLSGGVDSSMIVALMSRLQTNPIKTFCIGFDDPRFDESPFAQQVAELTGADHTCEIMRPDLTGVWPLTVYHNDQPHGDVSFMPTYWVSKIARRHVKVVLTGDGGDELFAGYDVHRRFFANNNLDGPREELERAYLQAISLFAPEDKQTLYSSESTRHIADADAFSFAQGHLENLRHLDPINQMLGLDVKLLLPGNNLVKPDRMAMAVSLEPRAPMLDYRFVELAFQIPGNLKFRDMTGKWIFKQTAERILPKALVHRKKQMFTVPIGNWFKDRLLPFVKETLLSPQSLDRGLFDQKVVSEMIENHAAGKANFTRQLRALISLEIWQRVFLDASFDHAPTYEEIGLSNPEQTFLSQSRAA